MKKNTAGFWRTDWFIGLALSFLLLVLGNGDLLQSLERKAYDMGVQMTSRSPSDRVAVIAIDKTSIDNIGRWPWSREIMADMVDQLVAAKAKVIASTIFYSEPQRDPGLVYVDRLMDVCGLAQEASPVAEADPAVAGPVTGPALSAPAAVTTATSGCPQIASLLLEAEQALNTDRRFGVAAERAGNMLFPVLFRLGDPMGRPDQPLPDYVRRNAVKVAGSGSGGTIPTADLDISVIPQLGNVAAAIGHLNVTHDVDGGVRTEPLVLGILPKPFLPCRCWWPPGVLIWGRRIFRCSPETT